MKVPKLELKIIGFALLLAVGHLILIAFAAFKLGISVPTCITDENDLAKPMFIEHEAKHFEVHFDAKMWMFQPNYIKLPTDSQLDIFLSSKDVLHGLFIADTNVNLMAIPGTIANATHTFSRPGRYQIICHEFCGSGHQNMHGVIEVVDGLEKAEVAGLPDGLLAAVGSDSGEPEAEEHGQNPVVDKGKELFQSRGCMACHSAGANKLVGPGFKGLYGSTQKLADGRSMLVDEDFLRNKIRNPQTMITEGYAAGMMPALPMDDEEITAIIEYIKTLK